MLFFTNCEKRLKINNRYICKFKMKNGKIFQPFLKSNVCNQWTSIAYVDIFDLQTQTYCEGEISLNEHIDIKLPDNDPPYLQSIMLMKYGDKNSAAMITNVIKCEILEKQ